MERDMVEVEEDELAASASRLPAMTDTGTFWFPGMGDDDAEAAETEFDLVQPLEASRLQLPVCFLLASPTTPPSQPYTTHPPRHYPSVTTPKSPLPEYPLPTHPQLLECTYLLRPS